MPHSKNKSGVTIFDAQAGKGSHTRYLYTKCKEVAVDSHTNLQLLLTREVLILKQRDKGNTCGSLWILHLCFRLFSSKPITFFFFYFLPPALIALRFLLMYLLKVQSWKS